MRRRGLMDRRAMRIMAARSEANGITISPELQRALTRGDVLAIALAVGVEIKAGAALPNSIRAWYRALNGNPSLTAIEEFARDVREVFVNSMSPQNAEVMS